MATMRQTDVTYAFAPNFLRQTSWDVPLGAGLLTKAHPGTTRDWLDVNETVEDVIDCTGQDLLFERVTSRFARLILNFECDVDTLAGWIAFAYGVAAAPSAGTNEVQTLTQVNATSGTAQIRFTHNYNMQLSAALGYQATAGQVQTALDNMSNIGAGNSVVAGGPFGTAPITVTFQGALVNTDVANLEIVSALNGVGAAINVVETTKGVGRTHNISRLAAYQLPYTTLYVGYRGSSKQPVIFKNATVNSIRVRASTREVVSVTVELIGSADLQSAVGYSMPACADVMPIYFGDCSFLVGGEDLYLPNGPLWSPGESVPIMWDWEWLYQNNILTGRHAFTGQGREITRTERANLRPSSLTFGALGQKGDPLYEVAKAVDPRYITSLALRMGAASRHVLVNAPQSILKLDGGGIRHEGEEPESHLRLIGRPKKISGDVMTPSNVTAVTGQTTAYLIAA